MSYFGDLLLASNSPRRLVLLSDAGFDVQILTGLACEESYPSDLTVNSIPEYLSLRKIEPFRDIATDENKPLVAADTIVALDNVALGKPCDKKEALEILRLLNGKAHTVISGVTLYYPNVGEISFSESTKVHFAQMPDKLLRYYVDEFLPLDKAGSYGIQEWIGMVGVERIEGDFYNVMGFPVSRFIKEFMNLSERFC